MGTWSNKRTANEGGTHECRDPLPQTVGVTAGTRKLKTIVAKSLRTKTNEFDKHRVSCDEQTGNQKNGI